MKKLYKSLPADMKPNGFQWTVGKWEKERKIKICERGFHASENIIDAMGFVSAGVLAEVEVRGKSQKQNDKQCWSEMKIVRAWKWDKKDSVALAIYAAELVIDIFEKEHPDDKRPRQAIEAAKTYLKEPTEKNREAAEEAAEAAEEAAEAAEAAEEAAWAAAEAAWAAAEAAWAAAWAAEAAAKAAWAAEEAAWAAAEADEIKTKCSAFVLKRLKNKKPL